MLFRKKYSTIIENLENRKIIFFVWPRQVWKTTILKKVYNSLKTDKKLFLNLEILDYHKYFESFEEIKNLLIKNGFSSKIETDSLNSLGANTWENKFYLFLDEFHKVKNISWILKSLYDEFENLKIIVTWSNNIEINKNITESFAGRKRLINCYSLDFEEFIIWKENLEPLKIKLFIENPLNKGKINLYLEEFLIYWWYPEVVKTKSREEKKQVFADIFSFWFNKDILPEIKKDYKFNDFLKQVAFYNWELLNLNEISKNIWVSQPTVQNYIDLLEQSLILYPVRPFFTNKLKEIIKMPKYYFSDIGFRNFLINRFEFMNTEFWMLFENFIFSEMLKKWLHYNDIKFYRTKNGSTEVDFVLDLDKKAYEIKYKEKLKASDVKWLNKFSQSYPEFTTTVINKNNFYDSLINN